MHNTVAFDAFMLVFWAAILGVLVWMLVDELRRGRVPVKYGPMIWRKRNPISYWALIAMNVVMIGVFSWGCGFVLVDLIRR